MKKEEIIEKLKTLSLDKNKYIVIDDASLVLQGIIDEAIKIELVCDKEYYEEISWNSKIDFSNIEVKYNDVFEISCFPKDKINIIDYNGYQLMDIEECLNLKQKRNNKKDKKTIEKIDLYLCGKDNYRYERKLREKNISLIGGVDEVGRGPLVGPVVAACVILPEKFELDGLTDSKKLSEKKREDFYDKIMDQAISVGVGVINEKIIDEVNIYEATKMAMKEAIEKCEIKPEHILIDAMKLDIDIPTTSIIKGDLKSITISAASVIAKVTRDRMLIELDKKYPMYDFINNKGYPTKKHLDAINEYGIIKEHRRSYGPVNEYLKNHEK